MFVARDQENLVHRQQTAAASKPLNQGVKGLAPKTPVNNGLKNSTNTIIGGRTRAGVENENEPLGGKTTKAGKLQVFTPAPRDRAPLGAKTTNVKATAFQTPAPALRDAGLNKTTRKTVSARKHKLKVLPQEELDTIAAAEREDDEEPEIEYCPPKVQELPDIPDLELHITQETKFPLLNRSGFSNSWVELQYDSTDGRSRREREDENRMAELDAEYEKQFEESQRKISENMISDILPPAQDEPFKQKESPKSSMPPRHVSAPMLNDKAAAAALSSSRQTPHFASQTVATQAKRAASGPLNVARTRNPAAGSTASRTTIGHSAGRKVSASILQQSRGGKNKEYERESASSIAVPPKRAPQSEQLAQDLARRIETGRFWDDDSSDDDADQILFPCGQPSVEERLLEDAEEYALELPAS